MGDGGVPRTVQSISNIAIVAVRQGAIGFWEVNTWEYCMDGYKANDVTTEVLPVNQIASKTLGMLLVMIGHLPRRLFDSARM